MRGERADMTSFKELELEDFKKELAHKSNPQLLELLSDVSILENEDKSDIYVSELRRRALFSENETVPLIRCYYDFAKNGFTEVKVKTIKRIPFLVLFTILLILICLSAWIFSSFHLNTRILYLLIISLFLCAVFFTILPLIPCRCPRCRKRMKVAPSFKNDYASNFIEYCVSCKVYYETSHIRQEPMAN